MDARPAGGPPAADTPEVAVRRPHAVVAAALFLGALASAPGALRAQDAYVRLPVDSLERLLAHEPFGVVSFEDNRFEGDRTQRAVLAFGDGTRVEVKWARAPRGGGAFNNHPRYEVAAYRLQQLFLDPEDYVVPPTVVRCVPEAEHRRIDPAARATFGDDPCVLVVLQYWLQEVAEGEIFHEDRTAWDTTYARRVCHVNVFTVLAGHKDANRGNVLVGRDPHHPRFFAVDNGVAFGSPPSDRGDDWGELRIDRLPRATVERLRGISLEDLEAALGVVAQLERRDGVRVPVEPGPNLDPGDGIRRAGGVWKLGLTGREIRDVHRRLRRLLDDVDEGDVALFGPGCSDREGRC